MSDKKTVSVIIPMYNEEASCAERIALLLSEMGKMFGSGFEVIVSNDGSTDRTKEIIESLLPRCKNLRLVSYDDNRGKGSAVREGILASSGDIVFYTDCDLAYGTEIIGVMAKELMQSDADAVIGSRNISEDGYEGYTLLRKIASKTYIKLICAAAGFCHSDSQCGIKCFVGEKARRVFSLCRINGFAFDLEALMISEHFGYKITEQAVKIINHSESTSKVHLVRDTFRMLRDISVIKKRIAKM